ncbi:MAG: BTAD domain-containing putative transcriptional regulator, partial [Chloroflexota bacterium]
MTALQIRFFGRFQLVYNSHPVPTIHQMRQQSLLAYLILHPNIRHARRDIAFLFWPDVPEKQAFANLRKALYRLRKSLPDSPKFLDINPKSIRWRPDATYKLDIFEFNHALQQAEEAEKKRDYPQIAQNLAIARDLYKGELLPNCYDDWILAERERLHQQFIQVLTRLGEWQETKRDYDAAIGTAQKLLRYDPLHEATHRRLMELYLLKNEPAEALRIYHACTTLLQQELAVEPSAATRQVYERIRSNNHKPPTTNAIKPDQHLTLPPLVGRQGEWKQLISAWGVATRSPHCVTIVGEAGIGKSRLARELQIWAKRQGFHTLQSQAYESSQNLAYAPVVDWLRGDDLELDWQVINSTWLTEVVRLLPELLTQIPGLLAPQPLTQSWQRHHLFEALSRTILQIPTPLLLIVD